MLDCWSGHRGSATPEIGPPEVRRLTRARSSWWANAKRPVWRSGSTLGLMNKQTSRTPTLLVLLPMLIMVGCDGKSTDAVSAQVEHEPAELKPDVVAILEQARRIPNSTSWFEILELPNNVYAFWEPGHVERVNSFLIVGSERDVLYDTGMGIASLGRAVADLRRAEGLPAHELMVINSHNHLDHNGGNGDFERAYIIEDEWALRKLTEGLTGSAAAGFVTYWSELAEGSEIEPPEGFDPTTFEVPPYPRDRISFLADGDIVDLGDRRFRVIHTTSHSPDGLALYDEDNKILFGGDTYLGDSFLIRDLTLLQEDLAR